jgi:predicted ArsR family transcriptional regulator
LNTGIFISRGHITLKPDVDEIDRKVLAYLIEEDWPVTTEMVAKEVKVNWNTAQLHLYKLKAEGLVVGKRVGRQNQWMVTEKGKETKR